MAILLCQRFGLLLWKNGRLTIRHPVATAFQLLLPFMFILLQIMFEQPREINKKNTFFIPYNLNDFPKIFAGQNFNLATSRIAYSPNNNTQLNTIMLNTVKNINKQLKFTMKIKAYANSKEMERKLSSKTIISKTLFGAQFDDGLNGETALPADIKIIFRFPAEIRSSPNDRDWHTNVFFSPFITRLPNKLDNPGYFKEGFLTMQHEICYQLIAELANVSRSDLPHVFMQHYPYLPYEHNKNLGLQIETFPMFYMLAYMLYIMFFVKEITLEKEKQLKEVLKIMGLSNWLLWTTWFVWLFLFAFITTCLIVLALTSPFLGKRTLFPKGDMSTFLVFSVLFLTATITFAFFISTLFKKATLAMVFAMIMHYFTFMLFALALKSYAQMSHSQLMLLCLASNTALSFGLRLFLIYEGMGEGVHWHTVSKCLSPGDCLTLGDVMLMLAIDTALYLLLALYVEAVFPGDYGVPKKWYFLCTKSFWTTNRQSIAPEAVNESRGGSRKNDGAFEDQPSSSVGVQLRNLTKVYHTYNTKYVAVDGLSFDIYEDEITVLLGHNGAGKTTTISMLIGMFPPTSGTAYINGHDIRTKISEVRKNLGFCPQHNIIYDHLTVKEHLYFFSKLKGMKGSRLKAEITEYLVLLDLMEKKNKKVKTLSGGMKRKLSTAIALCGDSKFVFLDEPTAGMDPSARREIWNILQTHKHGRVILMTTHYMDEADLLGDRIAIMSEGVLKCYGTSFFLKKKYGGGYYLILDISQNCDPSSVSQLLNKYIPGIEIHSIAGSEMTYLLPENQVKVFEPMLSDLERNSKALGILSYGVSLSSLEEVFMKVGSKHIYSPKDTEISNKAFKEATAKIIGIEKLQGKQLSMNQFKAMFLKRFIYLKHNWINFCLQIIIPSALLCIFVLQNKNVLEVQHSAQLDFKLDDYSQPKTLISGDDVHRKARIYYKLYLKSNNYAFVDYETRDINTQFLKAAKQDYPKVRISYVVGASFFRNNTIVVWSNNEAFHAAPLSLNLIHNSILHETLNGTGRSISVTNHPLPTALKKENALGVGFNALVPIIIAMGFLFSFYILFYIRERSCKFKHIQFVSGANALVYWTSSYLYDLATYVAIVIIFIVIFACAQLNGMSTFQELGTIFLIFLLFGMAMLPLIYLMSFWWSQRVSGFSITFLLISFGNIMFLIILMLIKEPDVTETLMYVFSFIPSICLVCAYMGINDYYNKKLMCTSVCQKLFPEGSEQENCKRENCGNMNLWDFKKPGIGAFVVAFLISAVTYFGIVILIDYNFCRKRERAYTKKPAQEHEDVDVKDEKALMKMMPMQTIKNEYNLVVHDLVKKYGDFKAIREISFGVRRGECFGLLGLNGAGKSTTFKIVTGDARMTHGYVWVKGIDIQQNVRAAYAHVGYCPQFDALLDDFTLRENMRIVCMIRGYAARDDIAFIVETMAREFDFVEHLDKRFKQCSGGNKRKCSTTVALIGFPSLLLLDEPTAGMDPVAKRLLWNALCRFRDFDDTSIVLTTHSMEEAEALCTRVAVMVNGAFKCIGSTQHLKSRFSEGYTMVVKLIKTELIDAFERNVNRLSAFVHQTFKQVELKEQYQQLLTFYIGDTSQPWSRMFGIMEANRTQLNIEDYSLTQASLEQIFLGFTKHQRELHREV